MIRPICLAFMLLLPGCSGLTSTPEVVHVPVEVPGPPVPCIVPDVKKPAELVRTLKPEDSIHHKVKVILAERELNRAYKAELEAVINVCNQKD